MNVLFELTFWLAAPFWALMVLAPGWSGTRRVMDSAWVTVLPLGAYLPIAAGHFGELWRVVSAPELETLRAFLGQPYGAALIWAHLIAFDLFIGRWMYLEGRALRLSPLVISPILVLTVLLSPMGLLVFLVVRSACRIRRRPGDRERAGAPHGVG